MSTILTIGRLLNILLRRIKHTAGGNKAQNHMDNLIMFMGLVVFLTMIGYVLDYGSVTDFGHAITSIEKNCNTLWSVSAFFPFLWKRRSKKYCL